MLKRDFFIPHDKLRGTRLEWLITDDTPIESTLFFNLWTSCMGIAVKVLKTDYFKGIVNGDLDPNNYGQLMVQDAYYCFNGQNDYVTGATCADNDDWKVFYNQKADSYAEYNKTYHKDWHIHDIESVTPGDAIKEYAQYEAYVAGSLDSPYLSVVMLPCEYLWNWVANIIDGYTPEDSIYRFWVDWNGGEPSGAIQMAQMLEKYRSEIDEKKAMEIFRKAMEYELKVFTDACQQTNQILTK